MARNFINQHNFICHELKGEDEMDKIVKSFNEHS